MTAILAPFAVALILGLIVAIVLTLADIFADARRFPDP